MIYFDPVSSATIVSPEQYRQFGMPVAAQTIAQIKGAVGIHFASGRCLPILDDVIQTGAGLVGVSTDEDLAELKTIAAGRVALAGNLNGIEMSRWTDAQAEAAVKKAIAGGAKGGGFILTDNHGEIPFQVPGEVISAISEAARTWGRYPLNWVEEYA
jgi:uroporphyrinogen decarboxylase